MAYQHKVINLKHERIKRNMARYIANIKSGIMNNLHMCLNSVGKSGHKPRKHSKETKSGKNE